jgi:putative chitinase
MLENLGAAIGVGNPLLITAIADTWLKPTLEDSTDPINSAKKQFSKGDTVEAYTHKVVGRHLSIECFIDGLSKQRFLWLEHIDYEGKPANQLLTYGQLCNIAIDTSTHKLMPLVVPLNEAMAKYSINTPLRIAHFIAQMAHESDGFNALEEYASGEAYEGRTDLGNTQEGDGVRFRGRTFVMITGRENYQQFSNYLGVDFISNPELLATPKYAALGAGWFWDSRKLNQYADNDNINEITYRINGGFNHLDQRKQYLYRAKIALGL